MKTIYFVDIHIRNGAISRFYHRVSEGANIQLGLVSSGPNYKFIRLSTTKQCYLSYLKTNKPYRYHELTKYEKR